MSGRTRGYAHRVDIAAGAPRVWKTLTDPEALRKWCAPDAQMNAKEGGHFRASVDRVMELEAHIDVLVPERRLRMIYLPTDELPESGSAIVDDFMIDDSDPKLTILRLLGSGFPTMRLRTGWQRAVARLKVLAEHREKEAS
jgi:uncharacterized protein YndB with AHSA1/START domain